jgi:BirA family transcriptional regulator, biotin operon repressor / biotin---[acetyl-CoA-carboxylase] ligase
VINLCTIHRFKNSNLLPIGHAFIELESVDSTNNYAMAQVHAGSASHGTIFFAHEQWAGKGQREKTWISSPGENIVMSVVLEPVFLPITGQFLLSAAVALSCYDLFSRYAGIEQTAIKWPNDLYWRDRKAGGILIENSFRGDRWLFAIAGIGININQSQFPEGLQNPVSLLQITGRSLDAATLSRELGECLEIRFGQLRSEMTRRVSGPVSILEEYNAHLYKRGGSVRLKKNQTVFETIIQGVSSEGELITKDTMERRFTFGEIEWVIGR